MHDLKERLEPVKLSDAQKERIVRNVKEGQLRPMRPRIQKGPLFASVILGVAVLFLMFNLLTEPAPLLQSGGGQAAEQEDHAANSSFALTMWNGLAVVMMILAMVGTKRAVLHVKRWQSQPIVRYVRPVFASRRRFIGWLLILNGLIIGGSLLLDGALFYTHAWIAVSYVVAFFMFAVYQTRDSQKTSCPHCGIEFTRKQVRQKTKWQYRETCDTCEKPIYVDPKRNGDTAYLIFPAFLLFNGILNMHYLLVIAIVAISFWLLLKYITPYSIQFIAERKDDPKMW